MTSKNKKIVLIVCILLAAIIGIVSYKFFTKETFVKNIHGSDIGLSNATETSNVTINFDLNGGTGGPHSFICTTGTGTMPIQVPIKSRYIFEGWARKTQPNMVWCIAGGNFNLENNLTASDYEEDGSLKLIAVWAHEDFTVKHVLNGGTGVSDTYRYHFESIHQTSVAVISNIPTKSGYEFEFWLTNSNLKYRPGYPINPDDFTDIDYTADGFVVFSAQWKMIPINMVLDRNGGEGAGGKYLCTSGKMPSQSPTKSGYEFEGWARKSQPNQVWCKAGDTIDASDLVEADYEEDGSLILTAVWKAVSTDTGLKIIFDTNGGTGGPDAFVCYTDSGIMPSEVPTKSGYIFEGWATKSYPNMVWCPAGGNYYITHYIEQDFEEDGSLILIAVWSAKKYKIVLNHNDGSNTKDYIYVKYGDGIYKYEDYGQKYEQDNMGKITIDEIPTREGYTFDGYDKDTEGNSIQIDSTGTTTSGTWNYLVYKDTTEDYNLYAVWTINPPEIVEVRGNSETWTNQDITLSVVVKENQQLADKAYSFDGGTTWQSENEKTYTENTSGIEVCIKDPEGNIGTYPAINIDKIDKEAPVFGVFKNESTEGYTIATGDSNGSGVASCTVNGNPLTPVTSDNGMYRFVPEKSGIYIIKVTDYAGNSSEDELTVDLPSDDKVSVTGVTLDKNKLNLKVNETEELKATITPENATNKNVTFSSSDESIVEVNNDGSVTAKKIGTATITVTTEDGNKTATCEVTVVSETKGYKVEHYKQQENKEYKIEETENKTGVVGTTVTADKKEYEGYTFNSSKSKNSGVVLVDGSLTLKMYYDFEQIVSSFIVKHYKEDENGTYVEVKEEETTETGTIGEIVKARVKSYEGYIYNKNKSEESISGEVAEDGSLVLGVYYRRLKAPYIEIITKDSETQEVKEGVKATLFDNEGKEILTGVSDEVGKVAFENLEKEKEYSYKIEGDSKEYKIRVTKDGKIETIKDEKPSEKPDEEPSENPKEENISQNQTNGNVDNTKSENKIPNAGMKVKFIFVFVTVLIGFIVVSYIKYKRLNKIC